MQRLKPDEQPGELDARKRRLPSVQQKNPVVPRTMRAVRSVEDSRKPRKLADKKSARPVVLKDGPPVNGKKLNAELRKRRKPSARNDVAVAKSGKQRQPPMVSPIPTAIVVLAATAKPKRTKNAVAAGRQGVLPAKPSPPGKTKNALPGGTRRKPVPFLMNTSTRNPRSTGNRPRGPTAVRALG
jgi:hypothetical protein